MDKATTIKWLEGLRNYSELLQGFHAVIKHCGYDSLNEIQEMVLIKELGEAYDKASHYQYHRDQDVIAFAKNYTGPTKFMIGLRDWIETHGEDQVSYRQYTVAKSIYKQESLAYQKGLSYVAV